MKVRCIKNTGNDLRPYEYEIFKNKEIYGRFGASAYSEYNEIKIGKTYLVMGLIIYETYQAYLIDDEGFISSCPCQLFEVVNSEISKSWYFRLIEKSEEIYPFIQAIFGYSELCFDVKSYVKLIVEKDEQTREIYFTRKIELENELRTEA